MPFRDLAYDAFSPDCPAGSVLALLLLLAQKWSTLILYAFSEGTQSTGLRRPAGGMSEKMLI